MKKRLWIIGGVILVLAIFFFTWWFFEKEEGTEEVRQLIERSIQDDGKMQHQLYYEFTPKNEMFYTLLKNNEKNEGEVLALSETRDGDTIGNLSFRLNAEYHAFYYQKGNESVSLQSKAGLFQEKGDPKWAMIFDSLTRKNTLKELLLTFSKTAKSKTDEVSVEGKSFERTTLTKGGYKVELYSDREEDLVRYVAYKIPFDKSIGGGLIQGRIDLDSEESVPFKKLSTKKYESLYDFLINTMKKDTE